MVDKLIAQSLRQAGRVRKRENRGERVVFIGFLVYFVGVQYFLLVGFVLAQI